VQDVVDILGIRVRLALEPADFENQLRFAEVHDRHLGAGGFALVLEADPAAEADHRLRQGGVRNHPPGDIHLETIKAYLFTIARHLYVDRCRATARLASGRDDVPGLIRGVRLVFLALAAGAAGAGWILGDALPLIVALVIAGIDVVETSFLLLVVATGRTTHGADDA
jgi:hypothetical protein